MVAPVVVKIGGHEIGEPQFLTGLAQVIGELAAPVVLVHGGGKEISLLQEQLGIEPRYLDGVRITDEASLAVVEMVLCGMINKRLVRYLVSGGIDAQGLSGVDRGFIRADKMPHPTMDMRRTGTVTSVRGEVIGDLLEKGVTPVVAPVCMGDDGNYNVNADHVAGAVAAAIGAQQVVFLTNVQGVLVDGAVIPALTAQQAEQLIAGQVITDGMIPKVRTAIEVLDLRVPWSVITNLAGLQSNGGTIFTLS